MMVTRGMLVFRKCISGYRDSSLPSRSFPRSADSEGWRRLFLRNVRILLHSCLWDIADHCSLASFVGSRNGLSEAESFWHKHTCGRAWERKPLSRAGHAPAFSGWPLLFQCRKEIIRIKGPGCFAPHPTCHFTKTTNMFQIFKHLFKWFRDILEIRWNRRLYTFDLVFHLTVSWFSLASLGEKTLID